MYGSFKFYRKKISSANHTDMVCERIEKVMITVPNMIH